MSPGRVAWLLAAVTAFAEGAGAEPSPAPSTPSSAPSAAAPAPSTPSSAPRPLVPTPSATPLEHSAPVSDQNSPGLGHTAPALRVSLQLHEVRRLHVDMPVQRVSVADASVAQVSLREPKAVEVHGQAPGRTLVILWTGSERRLLVVEVGAPDLPAQAKRRSSSDTPGSVNLRGNRSLYMYRGLLAAGTSQGTDGYGYLGQQHFVSGRTSVSGGMTSAQVHLSVPRREQTTVTYAHFAYDDPRWSLEAGDIYLHALSDLGVTPAVRGGSAAYHDAKYRLTLYGGLEREGRPSLYDVGGSPQVGMQAQFQTSDALLLSLQTVGRQRDTVEAQRETLLTATPAIRWSPYGPLAANAEASLHQQGSAGRLRLVYESPLLTVHTLYQISTADYSSYGVPATDTAQILAMSQPSNFYRVQLLAGGSSLGGHLLGDPRLTQSYVDSYLHVFPTGDESHWLVEGRYFQNGLTDHGYLAGQSATSTTSVLTSHEERLGIMASFSSYRAYLRTGVLARQRQARGHQARALLGEPGETPEVGCYAEAFGNLWRDALLLRTTVTYRQQGVSSPVWQEVVAGPTLSARLRQVWIHLGGAITHEQQDDLRSRTSTYGRLAMSYRPTVAHELRGDVYLGWQSRQDSMHVRVWGRQANPVLTTQLSYAYLFGSAVDAEPLWGMFNQGSVNLQAFVDLNDNGVLDQGERPAVGVVAELDGEEQTTMDNGLARFSGLRPGSHRVRVNPRSTQGLRFTTPTQWQVRLERGQETTIFFGVSDRGSVFGSVFNDTNLDGQRQAGEEGIDKVILRIMANGEVAEQVSTGPTGVFQSKGLAPGSYEVVLDPRTLPPNFVARTASNGHIHGSGNGSGNGSGSGSGSGSGNGSGNGNGNGNGKNGHTNGAASTSQGAPSDSAITKGLPVTISQGESLILTIPVQAVRYLSGRVFVDKNQSREWDEGDQAVANCTVRINGYETATNEEGQYLFRSLPAGTLTVRIEEESLPPGLRPLSPPAIDLNLPSQPIRRYVDFCLTR